jgi:uncharacterized protein with FMN-binding domain
MSRNQPNSGFNLIRWLRKFTVSAFVVLTFIAYALHQQVMNPISAAVSNPPVSGGPQGQAAVQPTTPSFVVTPARPAQQPAQQAAPTNPPPTNTPAPTASAVAQGQYKDGQYTGGNYNVFYGNVQVKAIIQGGKLTNVQVLNYPSDRRTSQRINQQAIPWLTQEAVQAQSANVDFISGATLTSEGFLQSLQDALTNAHSS